MQHMQSTTPPVMQAAFAQWQISLAEQFNKFVFVLIAEQAICFAGSLNSGLLSGTAGQHNSYIDKKVRVPCKVAT